MNAEIRYVIIRKTGASAEPTAHGPYSDEETERILIQPVKPGETWSKIRHSTEAL